MEENEIKEKNPRGNPAWVKGFKPESHPNYTRKRKTPRDLSKLARTYTREALEEVVEVLRTAEKKGDRLKAAEIILDRGYGKAPQKIELTAADLDDSKKSEFQLLFESAAQRAHESLRALPAPPVTIDQTPAENSEPLAQEKSQLRDKAQLALDVANAAGISVYETREGFGQLPREIK